MKPRLSRLLPPDSVGTAIVGSSKRTALNHNNYQKSLAMNKKNLLEKIRNSDKVSFWCKNFRSRSNSDPDYRSYRLPKCKQVIFSDRAFASLIAETNNHPDTETGGILLGQIKDGFWYIIENLDPGPKSIFQVAYFEYDQEYVNHLAQKINQIYQHPLILLGLWHRHPGSLDSFSSLDDETNQKFANLNLDYGAISGLVNLDPEFRLTMYHVDTPLSYTKIPVQVGDKSIPIAFRQLRI